MATNGYTQPSVSMFLAKRVMPVPSFIIVTEELGKNSGSSAIAWWSLYG